MSDYSDPAINLAIIGGSGFYHLDPSKSNKPNSKTAQTNYLDITTAFATEAIRLSQEAINARAVYFIPRHGVQHNLPPHKINYRANLWALKEAGVEKIIAVNAVGGINPQMMSGSLVIPDQLIDYTWGREHTFFDGLNSLQDHIDFTHPYDVELRSVLLDEAKSLKLSVFKEACFGCTQGPRLETAAEIQKLKSDGCDIVGMTGMPEAALAREFGISYACIALVVNPAAGLSEEIISIDKIKKVLDDGLQEVRKLLSACIEKL
jgi:5'-methylthioinosine phosphorylase